MNASPIPAHADSFCRRFALQAPILPAPMTGVCTAGLSIAAGGRGALRAVPCPAQAIGRWKGAPARPVAGVLQTMGMQAGALL
ncbi:hypothetical protein [Stenotrophomonas sp. YIM B06876]|uniref:hypothetical protein n=1 Tax=Stenotrophomonas sp. YIM B06876 TaxID=3060211 RepID=UPI002738E427|nr:hypothetical protein [Stenotrophomonas sp. YIM B06876]